MQEIKIVPEEIVVIRDKFQNIAQRRLEHNSNLKFLLENLRDVKSEGFVEEIVNKLEDHIKNVDTVQVNNILYSSEFLDNLLENMIEVDETILKDK